MGRRSTRGHGLRTRLQGAPLVACCQTQQAFDRPNRRHPAAAFTGFRSRQPLTVTSGDERIAFSVEVADTPEAQARGLMFRTELGDNEGMIFPYDGTRAQSFWMKNTPLPLDIIYIGPDRRISNIAAETEPYSLEPVYSVGPVLGVLELRGGRAAELGIEPTIWSNGNCASTRMRALEQGASSANRADADFLARSSPGGTVPPSAPVVRPRGEHVGLAGNKYPLEEGRRGRRATLGDLRGRDVRAACRAMARLAPRCVR